jgi:phage protein D
MANGSQRRRMTPEIRLTVEGTELSEDAKNDVLSLTVQDDLGYPSAFSLRLSNWDDAKVDMKWSDRDLFQTGKPAAIEMGYRDHLVPIISGEITGAELSVDVEEMPIFTVRGYDRWHRLMRGKKTNSYTKMKDSDIASQIASDLGLAADTEDSGQTLDYVLQRNQTDADFLRGRAQRIGYEVFVQDTKLVYRKRKYQEPQALQLSREDDGLELHVRLSTMQQVSDIAVRGWDISGKKAIIGTARSSDETAKMGGKEGGLQTASDAFGSATVAGVMDIPSSQAEADQLAKAMLQQKALSYITAEGRCIGRADLRAGAVAQIDGLGLRFSGLYYIDSTRHIYTRTTGYRTEFVARRSAA